MKTASIVLKSTKDLDVLLGITNNNILSTFPKFMTELKVSASNVQDFTSSFKKRLSMLNSKKFRTRCQIDRGSLVFH